MFFPGSNITCFAFYIHLWPIYRLAFAVYCIFMYILVVTIWWRFSPWKNCWATETAVAK
jgi:hypothetical protein